MKSPLANTLAYKSNYEGPEVSHEVWWPWLSVKWLAVKLIRLVFEG